MMSYDEALIYAIGIVISSAINAILVNQTLLYALHIGMKIRVGVCSIIYRKVSSTLLIKYKPSSSIFIYLLKFLLFYSICF